MSDRTIIRIFWTLVILLILSVLAIIVGITGQLVTSGTVRTW